CCVTDVGTVHVLAGAKLPQRNDLAVRPRPAGLAHSSGLRRAVRAVLHARLRFSRELLNHQGCQAALAVCWKIISRVTRIAAGCGRSVDYQNTQFPTAKDLPCLSSYSFIS